MKKFLLFLLLLTLSSTTYPTTPLATSQKNSSVTFLEMMDIFFRVFPDPTLEENKLLPSLDNAITQVYHEGLGLPDTIIVNIKKFYAYLQKLAIDKALAAEEIEINKTKYAISTAKQNDPQLPQLKEKLENILKDFETKKAALDGSIINLCINTSVWQQHLQVFIADSFSYEITLLNSVHEQEKEIFNYLPTFETAYYSQGYTQLRNGSELVRMFLVLTDAMRERAVAQCPEWQNINNPSKLYDAIETFKEGDFYTFARSFDLLSSNTARFPFPQNATLLNPDGSIVSSFQQYFNFNSQKKLSVTPNGAIAFGVDDNNHPYFTALGNFIFTYKEPTQSSSAGLSHKPAFEKLFEETPAGNVPTPLYLELIGFSAIKFLNSGTQYLFNSANLEDTMNKLEAVGPNVLQSFPNIIPYMPSDYVYLDDINQLTPLVDPGSADNTTTQNWFTHAFSSIKHAFEKAVDAIGSALKTIAHAAGDFFVNAFHAVVHFSEGLYYESGLACAFQHISYSQAKQKGGQLFNAVAKDMQDMGKDLTDIVNATADIAKNVMDVISTVQGQVIGAVLHDPNLGDDLTGLMESIADSYIDATADMANLYVEATSDMVRLTYEAVVVVSTTVGDVLENAASGGKAGFGDLTAMGNSFAKDIVSSMLSVASLFIKQFTDAFKNLMKGVGYLAASITDIIADISGLVAGINAAVHGENFSDAYKNEQAKINEHRRLIIGVVTTTIILAGSLAMVPFTGGSSLAIGIGVTMAVLGAGMMAMNVVGDAQQDTEAIHNKANQKELLDKFKTYVPDNEKVTAIFQKIALNEMTAKLAAEEQNYERGLVYFQNYLNEHLNSLTSTAAFGLGSFYNELTMTDTTHGTMIADPGFLYGIKTDRMGLNPAQGLRTYNIQRKSFAQEIADAPTQVLETTNKNPLTINPSISEFWLNQKDISNIKNGSALAAEVRWRSIYETEGAFYIGLFMTERFMDIDSLHALNKNYEDAQNLTSADAGYYIDKTWENLDAFNRNLLSFDHLARCFVMYRPNSSFQPTLGLYQHEGPNDGWIKQNVATVHYQRGVWYRMKIALNGNQTMVKCWQEGNPEPSWQANEKTEPATKFEKIEPIQLPELNNVTSVSNQTNNNSSSGSWKLSSINSEQQETKNQNTWTLSTQTSQGLQTQTGNNWVPKPTTENNNSTTETGYSGSLGFISSGAAVEYEIISPATVIEITPARKAQNDQVKEFFQSAGITELETERERSWVKQLQMQSAPNFGGQTLEPLSHEQIAQSIFIYKTTKTGLNPDYVVFGASVNNNNKTAQGLGMNPTNNPSIIVSLVTGKAYNSNWENIEQCSGVLAAFESAHPIDTATETLINNASNAYFTSLTQPITFANTTLTGLAQAFQNNGAVYSAKPLTPLLTTGLDYYVFANLDAQNHYTQYGLLPTTDAIPVNGLISLVSGNIYGFYTNGKRIDSLKGQTASAITIKALTDTSLYSSLYTSYKSRLGSTVYDAVEKQSIAYQVALQKANQPTPQPAPAPAQPPTSETEPEKHSIFWQLTHGGGENGPTPSNFNDLVNDGGNFDQLGGPG